MGVTRGWGVLDSPGMRNWFVKCAGVTGLLGVTAGPLVALSFTDVTTASGITHTQSTVGNTFVPQVPKSGGAAAGDYAGDGWVDLYVTRLGAANILYRNRGDGTFEDETAAAFGAGHLAGFMSNGCGWGDIDNDGDLDLYVLQLEATQYHLYINDGMGGFTEEAVGRGANPGGFSTKYGNSVAFGDYDRDGYLDLHVTEWRMTFQVDGARHVRLLRNRGAAMPGHFEDVTVAAGVSTEGVGSLVLLLSLSLSSSSSSPGGNWSHNKYVGGLADTAQIREVNQS